MLSNKKIKNGYSFVESMIGIAVLSVGILAVLSMTIKTISSQDYIKNRESAILLSKEGIEIIKLKIGKNSIQCDSLDDNFKKNWNCWADDLLVDKNCECGDNIFSLDNNYIINFDGDNWTIDIASIDQWQTVYYNCLRDFCFYSHNKNSFDSTETKFSRKISVVESKDYNNDSFSDMIKIISSVKWLDRGDEKVVETISEIYK